MNLMCVVISRLQKGWESPSQINLLWYVKDREVKMLQIVCLMMNTDYQGVLGFLNMGLAVHMKL
jgi:hypothetical protein